MTPAVTSTPSNPTERITAAFQILSTSTKNLNELSGQLAKPIVSLERSLQRLNVGIACWRSVASGDDERGKCWSHDVGYSRIAGRWRLAVRKCERDEATDSMMEMEAWPFNETPLYLRIKAVDKLPELIEALAKATDAVSGRLRKKITPTEELAAAVNALTEPRKK